MGGRHRGAGTVTENGNDRYTVKVDFEERLFLMKERNRLRTQRFSRTRDLEPVTYRETLRSVIRELKEYREECDCLDHGEPQGRVEVAPSAGDRE